MHLCLCNLMTAILILHVRVVNLLHTFLKCTAHLAPVFDVYETVILIVRCVYEASQYLVIVIDRVQRIRLSHPAVETDEAGQLPSVTVE